MAELTPDEVGRLRVCPTCHWKIPVNSKCPRCTVVPIEQSEHLSAEDPEDEVVEDPFRSVRMALLIIAVVLAGMLIYELADRPEPVATGRSAEGESSGDGTGPRNCDRSTLDCSEQMATWLADEEGLKGPPRDAFVIAYQACTVYPVSDFVEQYGSGPTEYSAANTYARETFSPQARSAGEKGCLAGFNEDP